MDFASVPLSPVIITDLIFKTRHRGTPFFTKLSGTVIATPGSSLVKTSEDLTKEIRRGGAYVTSNCTDYFLSWTLNPAFSKREHFLGYGYVFDDRIVPVLYAYTLHLHLY
jgi:hypothetical protein